MMGQLIKDFLLIIEKQKEEVSNPILRNGDVISVGKSKLNSVNEVIGDITDPLQGIISSYAFLKF